MIVPGPQICCRNEIFVLPGLIASIISGNYVRETSVKKRNKIVQEITRNVAMCINKAIHALLMHGYATYNMIVPGPQICCRYEIFVLPGLIASIISGNYVRETSVKKRNKIVQEITRNVANVFRFYAIAIEHGFSMH